MHPLQKLIESENNDFYCRSYSGRSMFGNECLGIECDSLNQLIGWVISNINQLEDLDEHEEIANAFLNFKFDSLGQRTIVYFTTIKYTDDEDEGDEEEEDKEDE